MSYTPDPRGPSISIQNLNLTQGSSFNVTGRDQYNTYNHSSPPVPPWPLPANFYANLPLGGHAAGHAGYAAGSAASHAAAKPPEIRAKRLRILCLDGGGYRGYGSLVMLQQILQLAQPGKKPAELFPYQFFDLICGTSTGGLIALLLAKKKLSIEGAIKQYQALGPKVFGGDKGFMATIRAGHRFSSSDAREAYHAVAGDDLMLTEENGDGNTNCRCFVTVRNCHVAPSSAQAYLVRSYAADGVVFDIPIGYKWSVVEAACATSAAATLFEPLAICPDKNQRRQIYLFEDAGMFGVNNPSELALEEIKNISQFKDRDIGCFLSLGTGEGSASALPLSRKSHGIFSAIQAATKRIQKLIDDVGNQLTETESVHKRVHSKLTERNLQDKYFRFNPTGGTKDVDLAGWYLGAQIEGLIKTYLEQPEILQKIKKCAESLRSSPAS